MSFYQVGCHSSCDVLLRLRRSGHQNHLRASRASHGPSNVSRSGNGDIPAAIGVSQANDAAFDYRSQSLGISPPKYCLMPLIGQVSGGCISAVPATKYGYLHANIVGIWNPPSRSSSSFATCRAVRSSRKFATTCTPTGRPSLVCPIGTTVAGR